MRKHLGRLLPLLSGHVDICECYCITGHELMCLYMSVSMYVYCTE